MQLQTRLRVAIFEPENCKTMLLKKSLHLLFTASVVFFTASAYPTDFESQWTEFQRIRRPNACAKVRCANGYRCEIYKPTGEAFCNPDCKLNNGGCRADQSCNLKEVQCIRAPCPPVVKCIDKAVAAQSTVTCPNSFNSRRCSIGYRCEYSPSNGIHFCNGNCEHRNQNGGCFSDQICKLREYSCTNPNIFVCPVPTVYAVECIDKDPCAKLRCAIGYKCEIYQPTGRGICQPDCSLSNGGCYLSETCRLADAVYCGGPPCPQHIECVDNNTGSVRPRLSYDWP